MRFVFGILFLLMAFHLSAQQPTTAIEYLRYLNERDENFSQKYVNYSSAIAHGTKARKLEKIRTDLIKEVKTNITEIGRLKPFKGDAALRDASKHYWTVLLHVMQEDYGKIIDLEEIAEKSYDHMEAYLLAQEKAQEVSSLAGDAVMPIYREFAIKNNINLVEGNTSKLAMKMKKIGEVNQYHKKLFLIYFKTAVQHGYLSESLKANDLNGLEQNRNAIISLAAEGLEKLRDIENFKGDHSLIQGCRESLTQFKMVAENHIPARVELIMAEIQFNKFKESFDQKPANTRTKSDIDRYNHAVLEYRNVVNTWNEKHLNPMNKGNEKAFEAWNSASKRFLDKHTPRG
jgi:hypothetical protein